MRRLITSIAIAAAVLAGAALGSAVAASGSSTDAAGCPTSTTTTSTGSSTSPSSTTTAPHPLNEVVVENCYDGTKRARSKLQVARVRRNDAKPENLAYAYAHDCSTGCQAIAAAFQVVLIDKGANVQKPQNYAIAINQNCTGCGAFAYAFQYALDVPKRIRLSRQARRQIAAIRREVQADVKAADVRTFAGASDLDAKLKALAAQLKQDVDNGLQSQHVHPTHERSSQREVAHPQ